MGEFLDFLLNFLWGWPFYLLLAVVGVAAIYMWQMTDAGLKIGILGIALLTLGAIGLWRRWY